MAERASAALIIAGHGSARNPEGSASTHRHAEEIRRRGLFAEVSVGFCRQPPFLRKVTAAVSASEVFVVPHLTCKGYVATSLIPREMGLDGPVTERIGPDGRQRIHLCDPVGSHPDIAGIITRRLNFVIAGNGLDAADTALLVVGHGTTRDDASARQTLSLAAELDASAAFLEIPPFIGTWPQLTASPNVVVAPFLMADGSHASEDIPLLLGLDATDPRLLRLAEDGIPAGPFDVHGRRLWYCRAVGSEPEVVEIILDRVAAS